MISAKRLSPPMGLAELRPYAAVVRGEQWAVRLVLLSFGRDRGYCTRVESSNDPPAEADARVAEAERRLERAIMDQLSTEAQAAAGRPATATTPVRSDPRPAHGPARLSIE